MKVDIFKCMSFPSSKDSIADYHQPDQITSEHGTSYSMCDCAVHIQISLQCVLVISHVVIPKVPTSSEIPIWVIWFKKKKKKATVPLQLSVPLVLTDSSALSSKKCKMNHFRNADYTHTNWLGIPLHMLSDQ